MVWSKGSRGTDFNRYTFTWLQPRFELHVIKTVYSRNHWRRGLTRSSAAVTNLSWHWGQITQHQQLLPYIKLSFSQPMSCFTFTLPVLSPTLLVRKWGSVWCLAACWDYPKRTAQSRPVTVGYMGNRAALSLSGCWVKQWHHDRGWQHCRNKKGIIMA